MRIAIDAMGGDRAPAMPVEGALRAIETYEDVDIVLVGDPESIYAQPGDTRNARIHVHDAPEVVSCDEDPVRAIRASKKVSARACADLLHAGDVDGVLSMGNTGAAVAAATLYCRRLKGVKRTGIAVPFPRPGGVSICIDGGANPDAKPAHLHQYAIMAVEYVRAAFGVENPRVGLLSIGEEDNKGNRLVAETREYFKQSPIEGFIGNVEPHALFEDVADVVVCDGFSGNLILKAAEGMASFILRALPATLAEHGLSDPRPVLGAIAKRVDYADYGGAPLLGVEHPYVIGHGRSDGRAYLNGVRVIRSYFQGEVGRRIVERLASRSEEDLA
jgi:glycerol-3-phosphate acyltransferase PlsX